MSEKLRDHDLFEDSNNCQPVSEIQDQEFSIIEEMLEKLAVGMNKDVAKTFGVQLMSNINLVDLTLNTTEETKFGRNMYTNIKTMLQFGRQECLKKLVVTNYPIERFLRKREVALFNLEEEVKQIKRQLPSNLKQPDKDIYEFPMLKIICEETERLELRYRDEQEMSKKSKDIHSCFNNFSYEKDKMEKRYIAEWKCEYLRDLAIYNKQLESIEDCKIKQAQLTLEQDRTVILALIVEGFRSSMNAMVSKIKSAVNGCQNGNIKARLSCMVVLDSTAEMIANPFESNNLAGMVQILKTAYSKASLVTFNKDFSEALRCKISEYETNNNPVKAVESVDKIIGQWEAMDYWKYMTKDIFFVNILLKSLQADTEMKRLCVREVNQYLTKREAGEITDDTSSVGGDAMHGGMPVYRYLCNFLRLESDGTKYMSHSTSTGDKRKVFNNKRSEGGGEVAASAEDNLSLLKVLVSPEQDMKCTCIHTGNLFSYTATRVVCPKCSTNASDRHRMKCYVGVCKKCGLYGHKAVNCRQDASTYVVKKQAADTTKA